MQPFTINRVGALIVTPGMTAAEMEVVSHGIASLVRDVFAQDAPDWARVPSHLEDM